MYPDKFENDFVSPGPKKVRKGIERKANSETKWNNLIRILKRNKHREIQNTEDNEEKTIRTWVENTLTEILNFFFVAMSGFCGCRACIIFGTTGTLVEKFESYFPRPGVAYETERELTSENVYHWNKFPEFGKFSLKRHEKIHSE